MPDDLTKAARSITVGVLTTLVTIILFSLMGWLDWQLWGEPFFSRRHLVALIQCAGTSLAFYALSPTFRETISVLCRLSVSLLMAVLGGGAALALRELFIHSFRDLELVAAALLLIVVAASVAWSMIDDASRQFRTFWESRQREFVPLIIPFAAMLLLSDFVAPLWNSHIQPHVGFALSAAPQTDDPQYADFYRLLGSLGGLFGSIELTITIASITVLSVVVFERLEAVQRYVRLEPEEVDAAHKLGDAVRKAISNDQKLENIYLRQVKFSMRISSEELLEEIRREPLRGSKAIIKIFLAGPVRSLEGRHLLETLRQTLAGAEIEFNESIFIIYGAPDESNSVIAYGAGSEWDGLKSGSFIGAMISGVSSRVINAVSERRREVLASNPKGDILLSNMVFQDHLELREVLRQMGIGGLRRALVCSPVAPHAHSILCLDDVSRYLFPH